MTYKHKDYTLYCREIKWMGTPGKKRTIYFFAKKIPEIGTPCDLPAGYEIGVNTKTSMPYLKYASGRTSLWQTIKKK